MINFRYHVVSLAAVFLALAIGVVLGASVLGQGLNQQILEQAQADRQALAELREESLQQQAVSRYRDAYDERLGVLATRDLLIDRTVAVVALPAAPADVVEATSAAVEDAGGTVVNTITLTDKAFDETAAEDLDEVLGRFSGQVTASPDDSSAARLGATLARAAVAHDPLPSDEVSVDVLTALQRGRFLDAAETDAPRARLLVVVGAPLDVDQPMTADLLNARLAVVLALDAQVGGAVFAGPNSTGISGTDVATLRSAPGAARAVSSVDVADLTSGVTTVMLCLIEEEQGRSGHYGAAPTADAPAPELTR